LTASPALIAPPIFSAEIAAEGRGKPQPPILDAIHRALAILAEILDNPKE
jgi:hypothetical protein